MKSKRILIAGNEIGGQMQLLAEKMRKRWYNASSCAYNNDFRGYQNDIRINGKGFRPALSRFFFFIWATIHYDVFHFFWGKSMWSFWRFHLLDLPILRLLGKKVIVHFRGLDVIDIKHFDYLRERSRGADKTPPPINRRDQRKKIKKWRRYADVMLVSEPDLYTVVPDAQLSPQIIDMKEWDLPNRKSQRNDKDTIKIVHAPSSRRKKGTDFIEEAVSNLQQKGYSVELVLAEKLAHDQIKQLYKEADIGIDQVLYGWHGKVSVELMAMKKPVICNINPEFGKYRPDLPIVHADPHNLEDVLIDLIDHPEKRKEIGEQSYEYVKKYHDVETVIDELFDLYGIAEKTLKKDKITNAKTW